MRLFFVMQMLILELFDPYRILLVLVLMIMVANWNCTSWTFRLLQI